MNLVGVQCTDESPVIDTSIRHSTTPFPDLSMTILAIIRDGKLTLLRDGAEMMQPGDRVYFVCDSTHLSRAMAAFAHEEPEARSVVIAGGGAIGQMLATEIEENFQNTKVQIIERDAARAHFSPRTFAIPAFSMATRWIATFWLRLLIQRRPLSRSPMMTR